MAEINDSQQEQEVKSSPLTGGRMLAEARIAQALTVDYIARYLHLTESVIHSIEADEIPTHIPVIYLRGYLRSYAKLVGADGDTVVANYHKSERKDPGISAIQNIQKLPVPRRRLPFSLRFLVLGILIIAIFSGLAFWGYSGFPLPFHLGSGNISATATNTDEQKVAEPSSVGSDGNRELALSLSPEDTVPPASETADVGTVDGNDSTHQNASAEVKDRLDISAKSGSESAGSKLANSANDNKIHSENSKTDNSKSDTKADNHKAVVTPDSTKKAGTSSVDGTENLDFVFVEDCWIRVTDARGEVLAVGTKRKGYHFAVTGASPLKVDLGNPVGVQIKHNGKLIDLSAYPGGKPARINIDSPKFE